MNDYDKAGRYLVKREPAGFFRWLSANPRLTFQAWIDARRVALPNQNGCRLELSILRRRLAEEDASNLVADVAGGITSPWLLPWVPLMQGGGELGIIADWLPEAERRLTDERDRADLGLTTQVFASLAGCRAAWDQALRGWNMKTSPIFDEIREEGREEGRAEGMRALVVHQGRQKFGKTPTKKQQKALESVTDLARLEALAERLLDVDSWGQLLGEV
ncbi:MAG TPA: hypothetical protein VMV69_12115 [Pirellulales bacterium]|nr:hypothetical protein [Pirellulales bacterium]